MSCAVRWPLDCIAIIRRRQRESVARRPAIRPRRNPSQMSDLSFQAPEPRQAVWRGMTRDALDIAYDNTSAVPESGLFLANWSRDSAALRNRMPELVDIEYGPRDRNRIDIFRCGRPNAPLFVFIHGGYWQRNSREVFSCMAEGLLPHGIDVALPGYTLAPEADLHDILAEIHASIRWLRRDGPALGVANDRLIVSGWSAGGHLAASARRLPEVDAVIAISGIFDLDPIRRGRLNDKLNLSSEDVASLSPMRDLTDPKGTISVVYGLQELPELQRQSEEYAAALGRHGHDCRIFPVKDADHFSILEKLRHPDGEISRLVSTIAHPDVKFTAAACHSFQGQR